MKDKIISNYISNLSMEDIDNYSKKYLIALNDNEKKIVYDIIKNKWRDLLYGNQNIVLLHLKSKINQSSYQKIEILYYQFKDNYQNYL